jgi:hypothetical protein
MVVAVRMVVVAVRMVVVAVRVVVVAVRVVVVAVRVVVGVSMMVAIARPVDMRTLLIVTATSAVNMPRRQGIVGQALHQVIVVFALRHFEDAGIAAPVKVGIGLGKKMIGEEPASIPKHHRQCRPGTVPAPQGIGVQDESSEPHEGRGEQQQ